jgi:hypothetical protein
MGNTARINVGRLLEIDVSDGYRTVADIETMIEHIGGEIDAIGKVTPVVIVADWRACQTFAPDVADRTLRLLTRFTARIERSGILHRNDAPTSVLQVMRLIRETRFPARRVFTDTLALFQFLDPVLSPAEQAQLRTFVMRR